MSNQQFNQPIQPGQPGQYGQPVQPASPGQPAYPAQPIPPVSHTPPNAPPNPIAVPMPPTPSGSPRIPDDGQDSVEVADSGHGPLFYIAVAILSVALVAGVVVGAFFLFGGPQDDMTRAGLQPVNNMQDTSGIQERLDEATRNSMLSIGINKEIVFDNAEGAGKANIANYEGCPYDIQVDINLKSNDQQIYSSGLISPNEYIEYIQLESPLSPGSYDCSAVFNALDRKTGAQIGRSVIGIKVVVE